MFSDATLSLFSLPCMCFNMTWGTDNLGEKEALRKNLRDPIHNLCFGRGVCLMRTRNVSPLPGSPPTVSFVESAQNSRAVSDKNVFFVLLVLDLRIRYMSETSLEAFRGLG